MIQSMTAFSQVSLHTDNAILTWELRSVNHRYLDVTFRLPEPFRFLEPQLRSSLRGKVARGKLDFQLKIKDAGMKQTTAVVRNDVVAALLNDCQSLVAEHQLADDIKLSHVLAWPGVICEQLPVLDSLADSVALLFAQGIDKLVEGKRSEGQVLASAIEHRIQTLRQTIVDIRSQEALKLPALRDKLMVRLDALQLTVDSQRFEQELALLLLRFDISEEVDRLSAHVDEVAKVMMGSESSGRRLDFLMQELNREANTLSSKSESIALSKQAVQLKVLIEQMREQIQNIE